MSLRLADQQMDMLRHDDISINTEREAPPHPFERSFENSLAPIECKQKMAMITAERYEVSLSGMVKAA